MSEKNESTYYDLIDEVKKGNDLSFEKLLKQYEPMINACVIRHTPAWQDRDDARQEALTGFYRAAMTFDLGQPDVAFGLYAKICVTNALIDHARKMTRLKGENIDNLEADYYARNEALVDDPADQIIDEENAAALKKYIKANLSDFENEVWNMFTEGKGTEQIADAVGKTQRSVDNALYRIRKKLRALIYTNRY